MMALLTIDPGKDAGWAVWTGPGELFACGEGRSIYGAPVFVTEIPFVYPDDDRSVPNSLITLALNAGRHIGWPKYTACYGVYPRTWKGGKGKEAHHNAVLRSLSVPSDRVMVRDLASVPAARRHNVKDAVALGLWVWPRMAFLRTACDYTFPLIP